MLLVHDGIMVSRDHQFCRLSCASRCVVGLTQSSSIQRSEDVHDGANRIGVIEARHTAILLHFERPDDPAMLDAELVRGVLSED